MDYNGNAIEYVGRAPAAEDDGLWLQNEFWVHPEKETPPVDMRNAMIRHRGNNCILVGWNLGLLFAALGIVVPEWTIIDLASNLYIREYCCDAAKHRGLYEDLFDVNIWYPVDRRWLAFLVLDKTSGEKPYELWCPLRGGEQLRRNVTHEALFSAAVVRHFFRPFQRRYCERYSDNVYKQMACGSGLTV